MSTNRQLREIFCRYFSVTGQVDLGISIGQNGTALPPKRFACVDRQGFEFMPDLSNPVHQLTWAVTRSRQIRFANGPEQLQQAFETLGEHTKFQKFFPMRRRPDGPVSKDFHDTSALTHAPQISAIVPLWFLRLLVSLNIVSKKRCNPPFYTFWLNHVSLFPRSPRENWNKVFLFPINAEETKIRSMELT